ncbi:MAG: HEPN domain-containing protein [Leptospiraceae bacterium]|nr:HEPN domain-containing protein [Leptospiraceae bacterium]
MSIPKIKEEALRWLTTAKEELDAAEHLFTGGFFAKTCFHCLDKFYIPTRYPDGLPELTPGQSYRKSEAITALTAAKTVFQFAESYLN